jgi:hypothetical protein
MRKGVKNKKYILQKQKIRISYKDSINGRVRGQGGALAPQKKEGFKGRYAVPWFPCLVHRPLVVIITIYLQ